MQLYAHTYILIGNTYVYTQGKATLRPGEGNSWLQRDYMWIMMAYMWIMKTWTIMRSEVR